MQTERPTMDAKGHLLANQRRKKAWQRGQGGQMTFTTSSKTNNSTEQPMTEPNGPG